MARTRLLIRSTALVWQGLGLDMSILHLRNLRLRGWFARSAQAQAPEAGQVARFLDPVRAPPAPSHVCCAKPFARASQLLAPLLPNNRRSHLFFFSHSFIAFI